MSGDGRGSRARYRQAVVDEIDRYEATTAWWDSHTKPRWERFAVLRLRAAGRCRRILAALDGAAAAEPTSGKTTQRRT